MKGTFESLLALEDTSPDLAPNSSSSLRTLQESSHRGLPPVQSFTSLDSLVLDDTVQFLPVGDLLCSGAPSPSPSSLLFPKVQPPALSRPLGPYPPEVRKAKIARYKAKMNQRRAKVRVSRHFTGRSSVARGKTRVKGKFVRT